MYTCLSCGRGEYEDFTCDCHKSREVFEVWADNAAQRTYVVAYPRRQDPVKIGVQGNVSAEVDTFLQSFQTREGAENYIQYISGDPSAREPDPSAFSSD